MSASAVAVSGGWAGLLDADPTVLAVVVALIAASALGYLGRRLLGAGRRA